ncbi:putative amidohydrolase [Microbacterium sp. SORGH_AS 1204]|uniref:nitrilase family protein n=1 Tax=Microbacterium sp. SORGH_AS_1204 TaxID=3041785 RepID=UPI00278D0B8E|nr:nitrilase family protein [Microbacterium sp. SORGH_AS_1204]MDQ1135452.1 putative amidohydrolase [Microbacterium sp. SORGH_AS_1204]
MSTDFTIACAQIDPRIGDIDANIALSETAIRDAAALGARVIVLPECASAGWAFDDYAESLAAAQPIPGGPTVTAWHDLARELDVWICGGVSERDGDRVYNSAVLISPAGVESVYRKVHLWNSEKEVFDPGDDFPVVDTPFGRVGMLICYDAWFPESTRSLALQGADLVLAPSDWVPNPRQQPGPSLANMMAMANAHSNQVFVAACSRVGTERGQRFIGASVIVGHDGWILAGPAPDTPAVVTARIDPIGSRESRRADPFNRPLGDRRPEAYHLIETPEKRAPQ